MARTKRKVNMVVPTPAETAVTQAAYRTGGYVRLSLADGGKPGADTLDGQRNLVQSYIESQQGMVLEGLYCDNGNTGTDFERPAFEQLMEDVKSGKINCIVVKDLSRFGRNYKEVGNLLERVFPFLGVRFIAINDNFDTLTAERSAEGYIAVLLNIVNEMYSKDLSAKLSATFHSKQKNGDFIGAAPAYGYRKCADNRNKLEPDPETSHIVQRIFAMKKSGISSLEIARTFNAEGILSPGRLHCMRTGINNPRLAGSMWEYQRIYNILRDPVYLGHMAQGRSLQSFREGIPKKRQQRSDWVIVENTHEPLVDEETFRSVQAPKTDKQTHDDPCPENILKGLIFCADCGYRMARNKVVSKYNCVNYSYICRTHYSEPTRCSSKYINEKVLFPILLTAIRNQIETAVQMGALVGKLNSSQSFHNKKSDLDKRHTQTIAALTRKKSLCEGLYQSYVDKLFTESEYAELKQRYQTEIERLQAALDQLDAERMDTKLITPENRFLTAFSQFEDETELTREMAVALLERVNIGENKSISISFRYQDEYKALVSYIGEAYE